MEYSKTPLRPERCVSHISKATLWDVSGDGSVATCEFETPFNFQFSALEASGERKVGLATGHGADCNIQVARMLDDGIATGDDSVLDISDKLVHLSVVGVDIAAMHNLPLKVIPRARKWQEELAARQEYHVVAFHDAEVTRLDYENCGGTWIPGGTQAAVINRDTGATDAEAEAEIGRVFEQTRLGTDPDSDALRRELRRVLDIREPSRDSDKGIKWYELDQSSRFQRTLRRALEIPQNREAYNAGNALVRLSNTDISDKAMYNPEENAKLLILHDSDEADEQLAEFLKVPEPRTGVIGDIRLPMSFQVFPGDVGAGVVNMHGIKAVIKLRAVIRTPPENAEDDDNDSGSPNGYVNVDEDGAQTSSGEEEEEE